MLPMLLRQTPPMVQMEQTLPMQPRPTPLTLHLTNGMDHKSLLETAAIKPIAAKVHHHHS
jgi:hypothetical protein